MCATPSESVTDLVVAGVLKRYRKLKTIVPHAGATLPVLMDRVDLALPNGSDYPFTPAPVCEELAQALEATPILVDRVRQGVWRDNARRLFPAFGVSGATDGSRA